MVVRSERPLRPVSASRRAKRTNGQQQRLHSPPSTVGQRDGRN